MLNSERRREEQILLGNNICKSWKPTGNAIVYLNHYKTEQNFTSLHKIPTKNIFIHFLRNDLCIDIFRKFVGLAS